MNRKFYILLFVLFFSIFLTSCTGPYTEEDNGTTIELGIDDPFEIELTGNPSKGYIWDLVSIDPSIVKQIGKPEFETSDDTIGSGGKYTFKFQTIAAGQTTLILIYHRKFEDNKPPAKTYELKIVSGTMGRILED
ncbi:MAG: protease inhibitor I42 family protein [Bacteroidales bacterium]|nr:protease inhibitor I42 family protein [Bacteroidales bacterium]